MFRPCGRREWSMETWISCFQTPDYVIHMSHRFEHDKFSDRWGSLLLCLLNSHTLSSSQDSSHISQHESYLCLFLITHLKQNFMYVCSSVT